MHQLCQEIGHAVVLAAAVLVPLRFHGGYHYRWLVAATTVQLKAMKSKDWAVNMEKYLPYGQI